MEEKKKKTKRRLWRGLATTTASLLALSLSATSIVDSFRTDIDKFLGTQSTQMVTENGSADDYTFQSDYSSTTELLDAIEDLGERMSEEGTVLLKNENGALPLTEEETQQISLLGFSSYYPVQGGDMGSSLTENEGTDADTVDMVEAFTAKGFAINPTLQAMYEGMREQFMSETILPWGSVTYYRTTAPGIGGTFTSLEPSQETMDAAEPEWRSSMDDYNVMIVTIARAAGENCDYTPGEAGVNPDQDLNQADPLGLSDTERAVINAAVEAKEANGGKVIVLLNNASAMEIDEIKDNTGVDAILEIGFPGEYGFYGIADILSGDANPSGHLADTYAVDYSASPAAQNYGNYEWTNADSADPYVVSEDDPNMSYTFGTMCNETVIGQTFSKQLAAEYGAVIGNYSIWSNLTIFWGAGTNLHRTPYNARNHEYYSEDAVLTAGLASSYIATGKEYGVIIAPKHFAFNDTEINRSGIATFMTEQTARENGLRAVQSVVEDAGTLGMMTTYNRIGITAGNAHYGLLMNILRGEWGFSGLMSEDFIQDANYSVLKEAVHCGVTMTCNTGDSTMEAISAKWDYWTTENVSQDAQLMQDLKNVMTWQNYAIANSNAMDGLNETSTIESVNTWYDNALLAAQIVFAVLTLACVLMYVRNMKKES